MKSPTKNEPVNYHGWVISHYHAFADNKPARLVSRPSIFGWWNECLTCEGMVTIGGADTNYCFSNEDDAQKAIDKFIKEMT
jgi:hypothetical protein